MWVCNDLRTIVLVCPVKMHEIMMPWDWESRGQLANPCWAEIWPLSRCACVYCKKDWWCCGFCVSVTFSMFCCFLQYKEIYHSKIRDLCRRLKQQQHNFSTQEKILHQRAEQAICLISSKLYFCMVCLVCPLCTCEIIVSCVMILGFIISCDLTFIHLIDFTTAVVFKPIVNI